MLGAGLGGEMKKLSTIQATILQRMAHGGKLEFIGAPLNRFAWRHGGKPMLRRSSVEKLLGFGFIRVLGVQWWGNIYSITEAGREALRTMK